MWRDQVPSVDPAASGFSGQNVFNAMSAYFAALKTPARTATGALRDRFSFTVPVSEWNRIMGASTDIGYGVEWTADSVAGSRRIRVAYVLPNSPADQAGLRRGDELLEVQGVSANTTNAASLTLLNDYLFPDSAGLARPFILKRLDGQTIAVSMSATAIPQRPVLTSKVLLERDGRKVGYLSFNEHTLTAEAQLIAAVQKFQEQQVSDLVLDLRYNGGGLLYVASALSYMIAGPEATTGKVFERMVFNSRRVADNLDPDSVMPFLATSCLPNKDYQCTKRERLPTLSLRRVFVLSQSSTCSASESLINGLRGAGIEVVLIGGRTCGKPYGFTAKENCGIAYLPVEFAGVNHKNFGDFADGFVPAGSGPAGVSGCEVPDDLSHELGDPQEKQLAAALRYRIDGACPATAVAKTDAVTLRKSPQAFNWRPQRSLVLENKIRQPDLSDSMRAQ